MSTKRILAVSAFAVAFTTIIISLMLVTLNSNRDIGAVALPDTSSAPHNSPGQPLPDAPGLVVVTRETVQAVVSTLSRPETYSRDVTIENFWEDGQTTLVFKVTVRDGVTSLRVRLPVGREKRIVIAPDNLYIWYTGDRAPYSSGAALSGGSEGGSVSGSTGGDAGDPYRDADEWQMLITYEDILKKDAADILDAGYIEYGSEDCIYIKYRSSLPGYTTTCYVSRKLGLVTGAQEYDRNGELIYSMTAGVCSVGEADAVEFTLPDGASALVHLDSGA